MRDKALSRACKGIMKWEDHKFFVGFNLFLGILFLVCELWIRPHFEENFSLWKLWMYASDGYTKGFHHLNDVILWQELLEFLTLHMPGVAWFPLFVLFFSFASVLIIGNSLLFLARKKGYPYLFIFALLIALITQLMVNWFWVHQNRVAFLMCGAALSVIMAINGTDMEARLKRNIFLGAVLWFVGGMFFRPEVATATLVILLPGYVIYFWKNLKAGFFSYALFGTFLCLFFGFFFLKIQYSEDYYYQTEPDVEYEIVDRRNVVPISQMKTAEDSAKYMAVTQYWMLGDVEKTNPEFIRSVIDKPPGFFSRFLFFLRPSPSAHKQFVNIDAWFGLLKVNWKSSALYGLLVILIFIGSGWRRALAVSFFFMVSTLLLSFSFSINGYNRIVEPLLALIGCVGVFLLFAGSSFAASKKILSLGAVLSVLSLLYLGNELYAAKQRSSQLAVWEAARKQQVDTVMADPTRQYVVVLLEQAAFNTSDALQVFEGFNGKKMILPELVQCSANAGFLQKTTQMTGCPGTDFLCRIKFIKERASETIIIGTKERVEFYDYYMKAVYGFETDFSSAPAILFEGDVYFWLL